MNFNHKHLVYLTASFKNEVTQITNADITYSKKIEYKATERQGQKIQTKKSPH